MKTYLQAFHSTRNRLRKGFSLVEVTLASGITALALTTLLGLIPEGLKNIKEAGNVAAETRITSHIMGGISQAPWGPDGDDLLEYTFNGKRYYFDDQGVEIEREPEAAAGSALVAYVAEVHIPVRDVALKADATATEGEPAYDPYLRRVTVKVAGAVSEQFDFDRALPMAFRSYSTTIARLGRN